MHLLLDATCGDAPSSRADGHDPIPIPSVQGAYLSHLRAENCAVALSSLVMLCRLINPCTADGYTDDVFIPPFADTVNRGESMHSYARHARDPSRASIASMLLILPSSHGRLPLRRYRSARQVPLLTRDVQLLCEPDEPVRRSGSEGAPHPGRQAVDAGRVKHVLTWRRTAPRAVAR